VSNLRGEAANWKQQKMTVAMWLIKKIFEELASSCFAVGSQYSQVKI